MKPPGLYHLYALAYLFLPPGRASMIPFDSLFGFLGYWAVYLLAGDLYGRRIGLVVTVAAVLAINGVTVLDFGTEGFGLAESFMVLPAALAVRQYRRALGGPRIMPFFWCGIWVGVELLIKQTALPLVVTMAVHWTALILMTGSGARRWLTGSALMAGGATAAVTPFAIVSLVQGTWSRMLEVLGPGAAHQLNVYTAWPDQWNNVLPLWVPMVWCVLGIAWWAESWLQNRRHGSSHPWPLSSRDFGFLSIWLVCECVMLAYLPFRAFHYYVVSCLPLVLLSGTLWAGLGALRDKLPVRAALSCVSAACVLSIALSRIVVDTIVPIAIARYRSYDAVADRSYFDELVSREVIDFGVPPPDVEGQKSKVKGRRSKVKGRRSNVERPN